MADDLRQKITDILDAEGVAWDHLIDDLTAVISAPAECPHCAALFAAYEQMQARGEGDRPAERSGWEDHGVGTQ